MVAQHAVGTSYASSYYNIYSITQFLLVYSQTNLLTQVNYIYISVYYMRYDVVY